MIKQKIFFTYTLGFIHHTISGSISDIYIFGIGAEIYESDLKPLTAGTGGQHFFKMKDTSELEETFDYIIGMLLLLHFSDSVFTANIQSGMVNLQIERRVGKCINTLMYPQAE